MSVKAVIDTNVLVSAFLSKNQDSPTVRIANAIFDERFIPVYSPDMIAEYTEVLGRDYLKLQTARVYALIRQIQASVGLGTDPTIVNKIKGLRGFGGEERAEVVCGKRTKIATPVKMGALSGAIAFCYNVTINPPDSV